MVILANFFNWFLAPIHELGHCIFGWITLNPTFITGWYESRSIRDSVFMSLGGYLTEAAFLVFMSHVLCKKAPRGAWFILIPFYVAGLDSISYQGDILASTHGDSVLALAQVLWYFSWVIAGILIIRGRVATWETQASRRYKEPGEKPSRPTAPRSSPYGSPTRSAWPRTAFPRSLSSAR